MLIAGDKPPLMAPHNALRGARFGKGQVFYILYPNVRGAIQPDHNLLLVGRRKACRCCSSNWRRIPMRGCRWSASIRISSRIGK